MMIDFVYWAFYALGLAFAVSFLISIVTAFMGKPSWGQMRVTGWSNPSFI